MVNYKEMYDTGVGLINAGKLVDAIPYFNKAKEDRECRFCSLMKLYNLYLRLSYYSKCREMLEEVSDLLFDDQLFSIRAQLDLIELNFHTALEEFGNCMNFNTPYNNAYYTSFYGIADLYSEFGFYDIARNMYETVMTNDAHLASSAFRIIKLDLLEGDYRHAKKILESDERIKSEGKKYINNSLLIDYLLGIDISKRIEKSWMGQILIDDTSKTSIKHISEHKKLQDDSLSYFDENINLANLYEEVKERIKKMNFTSLAIYNYYIFRMGRDIGCFNGVPTQDICVNAIIGTDKIITMYPVNLSSEFNREGLLENQELLLRRGVR